MKQGQIQLTFNWMYVLIAGAVILLFFVGIVVKQSSVAEEQLAVEVVQIMDSIFTGAGVAENTKIFIDTSGLIDYTFFFGCADGVGEYGISGQGGTTQNAIDPLFAPAEVKTTQMITYTLPYKLPYKVMDFLFVTSATTKYAVFGRGSFMRDFMNATEGFNREFVEDISQINPGRNFHVRLVDIDGVLYGGFELPEQLVTMEDAQVSAVSVTPQGVVWYQKDGEVLRELNTPKKIISLGGERDAALFGAIFASNEETYQCNMEKAFLRLEYLNEVYLTKLQEMEEYYRANPLLGSDCLGTVATYSPNLVNVVGDHQFNARLCRVQPDRCPDLLLTAVEIQDLNDRLRRNCAAGVY